MSKKKKTQEECVCPNCVAAEMVESTATAVFNLIRREFHVWHEGLLEHLCPHERLQLVQRILATVSLEVSLMDADEMIPVSESE